MNKFIDNNLKKGFIQPSNSPQASPFFFVAKKDSKALRPCQDYCYLNKYTIKNVYPLPSINDLLNKLLGATIFTKLDIRWGYNNVRIKKGDEWKGAFITKRGLFEPTVMFFGMTNSPTIFQSMMNDYFTDMIAQGWVLIYIDDILIFSKKSKDHHERTIKVQKRLEKKDLFLKPEKCVFNAKEVEYLGFIVKPNEISMDPTKLAGIRDWIPPTNVKGVRSFLGFGNFYQRFIGNYAEIAKPLNELTKKTKVFEWSQKCQKAFDNLKKKFLEKPVLVVPDPTKPFYVESDAFKWATGAVLQQRYTDGDLKPCGYISHSFTPTERNYDIHDRELLGIIQALETWRHVLEESSHPITIFSDHKNLTYWKHTQKLNRRQARWSLYLSRFNLQLIHVPGSRMIQSDALSRRPDHIPENDDDNENIVILPDNLFINLINVELAKMIESATISDKLVQNISNVLSTKGIPPIKSSLSDWKIENGKLFYQERCYIPDSNGI